MRDWKKDAVVGGAWGLVSFLSLIYWGVDSVVLDSSRAMTWSAFQKGFLLPGYLTSLAVRYVESDPSTASLYTQAGPLGFGVFLLMSAGAGASLVYGLFHGYGSITGKRDKL